MTMDKDLLEGSGGDSVFVDLSVHGTHYQTNLYAVPTNLYVET
jgi:hypothetical protein